MKEFEYVFQESLAQYNEQSQTSVRHNLSLSEFTIVRHLGHGAFSNVYLVKNNNTGTHHAMKTLSKEHIVRKHLFSYLLNEKQILSSVDFTFCIHLQNSFIDNSFVYFIMPFISGGNMDVYLEKRNRFNENIARFYGAQVVLGLEYLHSLDIIHRDIKPRNILIEQTGFAKITDFGLAKIVKYRTYSICGTPEYIAPEIITRRGYGKAVDWWSLGILIFEMASGKVPFYSREELDVYSLAASLKYKMPKYFSSELKNLVRNIIQSDLSKRYGNLKNGIEDIKNHSWFHPIVWSTVLDKTMKPVFVPDESSLIEVEKSKEDIVLNIEQKDFFEKEFQDFESQIRL